MVCNQILRAFRQSHSATDASIEYPAMSPFQPSLQHAVTICGACGLRTSEKLLHARERFSQPRHQLPPFQVGACGRYQQIWSVML